MKICFLFFILFFSMDLFAQSESIENNVLSEETPEDDQVYNAEEFAQIKPQINLNKANAVELSSTGLLNKKQIQDIIHHRMVFGDFLSIYELQSISSLSRDTLFLLSSILYVPEVLGNHHSLQALMDEGSHYSLLRWSIKTRRSKGYLPDSKGNTPYPGADYNLLYRLRSSVSNVYQFGLSFEKDAGETLNWSPALRKYGFDYLSGYLILYPKTILQQIAVGDFHFRSGHGLIFGGNFFQSKNPEYWQSSWQMGTGFRPHSSSAEYGFFRGAGIKLQHQQIEGSLFYSITPQDGTLQADQSISALNTEGLHRTTSETDKRYNTQLQSMGGNVCYTFPNKRWKSGVEYLYNHFSRPLIPSDVYYHAANFHGSTHQIGGTFVQYLYASGMVFAETAFSSQHGKAIYGGIIHNLSRQNSWILQFWSANASFQSFQGNIPSYNSGIGNETGIYQAFLFSLSSKLKCSLGWSVFNNPQPSFNKKGPTYGSEWISRLTYQLKKSTIAFIQFRWRSNEQNYTADSSQSSHILPLTRSYITADLSHKENISWSFHSRVQWAIFDFPVQEKGYCLTQSIHYKWRPVQVTVQVSIFQTDSWDSRLYTYEPDVPLAFTIPPLSGKGIRLCWTATIKALKKTELAFKISHVTYEGQKSIGSGYDEVAGNEQWELKVQARIFL
ncbi:MAG: hypothetical protein JWO58_3055 [Chitinophagaceae bacterium]|nr:hypothetical protein [Chitinophagaceae bacterium]